MNVIGAVSINVEMDPETLEGQALVLEVTAFEEDPEGFESGVEYAGVGSMIPVACEP